jgi:hypothetical protein
MNKICSCMLAVLLSATIFLSGCAARRAQDYSCMPDTSECLDQACTFLTIKKLDQIDGKTLCVQFHVRQPGCYQFGLAVPASREEENQIDEDIKASKFTFAVYDQSGRRVMNALYPDTQKLLWRKGRPGVPYQLVTFVDDALDCRPRGVFDYTWSPEICTYHYNSYEVPTRIERGPTFLGNKETLYTLVVSVDTIAPQLPSEVSVAVIRSNSTDCESWNY